MSGVRFKLAHHLPESLGRRLSKKFHSEAT
jgi:hypothetical protein